MPALRASGTGCLLVRATNRAASNRNPGPPPRAAIFVQPAARLAPDQQSGHHQRSLPPSLDDRFQATPAYRIRLKQVMSWHNETRC